MTLVGRAENEAIELILGNILIALGGIMLGFLYPIPEYQSYSYFSTVFFGAGIIFDVRVLSKFAYELGAIKNEIVASRRDIEGVTAELRHQERVSNEASRKLGDTIVQIQRQKDELKEIERKTFAKYGSHARSTPVEEMVEKTFEKLDERLRNVEDKIGASSIGGRIRGSHRPY
ncbi:MAG: hypothetical protein ACREBU_16600 [Nitrososphaera sp.]